MDVGSCPCRLSGGCRDVPLLQLFFDLVNALAPVSQGEDQPDVLCLLRHNLVLAAIITLPVTINLAPPRHAFLKAFADAPLGVLGNGSGFFLRESRPDGQHHLRVSVPGVDAVGFKNNVRALVLQVPHIGQRVHCVSCESGNALAEDQVDLPILTVLDHLKESRPLLCAGTGYHWVGVNSRQLPAGLSLNESGVVTDLRVEAVHLRLVGDSCVSRYS